MISSLIYHELLIYIESISTYLLNYGDCKYAITIIIQMKIEIQ